jgi:hypothetical protein
VSQNEATAVGRADEPPRSRPLLVIEECLVTDRRLVHHRDEGIDDFRRSDGYGLEASQIRDVPEQWSHSEETCRITSQG